VVKFSGTGSVLTPSGGFSHSTARKGLNKWVCKNLFSWKGQNNSVWLFGKSYSPKQYRF